MYLVRRSDSHINIELEQPLLIVGDVKVDFSQKIKLDLMNLSGRPRYISNGKLFHFWINTFFIDRQKSTALTHSFINLNTEHGHVRQCRSAHTSGSQYLTITYYRSRLGGRKKKLSNPLPNCLSRSNVSAIAVSRKLVEHRVMSLPATIPSVL